MPRVAMAVCVGCLLAPGGPVAPAAEPADAMTLELLTTPGEGRQGFFPGEPLEARVLVEPTTGDLPQLVLHVGEEVFTSPLHIEEPRRQGGVAQGARIEHLFSIFVEPPPSRPGSSEMRHVLEKPGEYDVWVEDRQSGRTTNRIRVKVLPLDGPGMQEAFEAYKRLTDAVVMALGYDETVRTSNKEMDEFLERYGESPYAPVIRLARGVRQIGELQRKPIENKEDDVARQRSLAALAPCFEKVLAAKPNSSVLYRARFHLALTKGWGGDYAAALRLLRDLLQRFPTAPGNAKARDMVRELEGRPQDVP